MSILTCGTPSLADGGWSKWSESGSCPALCGPEAAGASVNRTRSCTAPAPANGGRACAGAGAESFPCHADPCPVWSRGKVKEMGPFERRLVTADSWREGSELKVKFVHTRVTN